MILKANLESIRHNVKTVKNRYNQEIIAVLKGINCDNQIANAMIDSGVDGVAGVTPQKVFGLTENEEVNSMALKPYKVGDYFYNHGYPYYSIECDRDGITQLNARHPGDYNVFLMVNVGESREGVEPNEIEQYIELCEPMRHVNLVGVAANPGCHSGEVEIDNVKALCDHADELGISRVSGGSTALLQHDIPERVDQLRLGEALLTGRHAVESYPIEGMKTDTFEVEATVIKDKGSHVVVDMGQCDTEPDSLLGEYAIEQSWSDMSIIRARDKNYGDTVTWEPKYWAIEKAYRSNNVMVDYSTH